MMTEADWGRSMKRVLRAAHAANKLIDQATPRKVNRIVRGIYAVESSTPGEFYRVDLRGVRPACTNKWCKQQPCKHATMAMAERDRELAQDAATVRAATAGRYRAPTTAAQSLEELFPD